MTFIRHFSILTKRFNISRFAAENRISLDPSKQTCYTPLLQTNLPSLVNVCQKITIAEELGLPEPPKKIMPGFFHFVNDNIGHYPDLSQQERIKRLKQDWCHLKESERKKYDNNYQSKLEAYNKEYKAYIDSLSEEQLTDMRNLRATRMKEKRMKRARKEWLKKLKESGKPDHPGTAFSQFYQKHAAHENFQDAVNKWRALSASKKEEYKLEAKKLLSEYQEKLATWEKRMKKTGQEDLLEKKPSLSK